MPTHQDRKMNPKADAQMKPELVNLSSNILDIQSPGPMKQIKQSEIGNHKEHNISQTHTHI